MVKEKGYKINLNTAPEAVIRALIYKTKSEEDAELRGRHDAARNIVEYRWRLMGNPITGWQDLSNIDGVGKAIFYRLWSMRDIIFFGPKAADANISFEDTAPHTYLVSRKNEILPENSDNEDVLAISPALRRFFKNTNSHSVRELKRYSLGAGIWIEESIRLVVYAGAFSLLYFWLAQPWWLAMLAATAAALLYFVGIHKEVYTVSYDYGSDKPNISIKSIFNIDPNQRLKLLLLPGLVNCIFPPLFLLLNNEVHYLHNHNTWAHGGALATKKRLNVSASVDEASDLENMLEQAERYIDYPLAERGFLEMAQAFRLQQEYGSLENAGYSPEEIRWLEALIKFYRAAKYPQSTGSEFKEIFTREPLREGVALQVREKKLLLPEDILSSMRPGDWVFVGCCQSRALLMNKETYERFYQERVAYLDRRGDLESISKAETDSRLLDICWPVELSKEIRIPEFILQVYQYRWKSDMGVVVVPVDSDYIEIYTREFYELRKRAMQPRGFRMSLSDFQLEREYEIFLKQMRQAGLKLEGRPEQMDAEQIIVQAARALVAKSFRDGELVWSPTRGWSALDHDLVAVFISCVGKLADRIVNLSGNWGGPGVEINLRDLPVDSREIVRYELDRAVKSRNRSEKTISIVFTASQADIGITEICFQEALGKRLIEDPAGASTDLLRSAQKAAECGQAGFALLAADAIKACDEYAFNQKISKQPINEEFFYNHMALGWILLRYLLSHPNEAVYGQTYSPLLFMLYNAGSDQELGFVARDLDLLSTAMEEMAICMSRNYFTQSVEFCLDDWQKVVLPWLSLRSVQDPTLKEIRVDFQDETHCRMISAAYEPIYQLRTNTCYYYSWYEQEVNAHFPRVKMNGLHGNHLDMPFFEVVTRFRCITSMCQRSDALIRVSGVLALLIAGNADQAKPELEEAIAFLKNIFLDQDTLCWFKAEVFARFTPFFEMYPEMAPLLASMPWDISLRDQAAVLVKQSYKDWMSGNKENIISQLQEAINLLRTGSNLEEDLVWLKDRIYDEFWTTFNTVVEMNQFVNSLQWNGSVGSSQAETYPNAPLSLFSGRIKNSKFRGIYDNFIAPLWEEAVFRLFLFWQFTPLLLKSLDSCGIHGPPVAYISCITALFISIPLFAALHGNKNFISRVIASAVITIAFFAPIIIIPQAPHIFIVCFVASLAAHILYNILFSDLKLELLPSASARLNRGAKVLFLIGVDNKEFHFGQYLLASKLKADGMNVAFLPIRGIDPVFTDSISQGILAYDPNMICITASGPSLPRIRNLITQIKGISPAIIVGGGPAARICLEDMQYCGYDAIISGETGEAEYLLSELCKITKSRNRLDLKSNLTENDQVLLNAIPGVWLRLDENRSIKTEMPLRRKAADLDALPWDAELFRQLYVDLGLNSNGAIAVNSSIGCTGKCLFCYRRQGCISVLSNQELINRLKMMVEIAKESDEPLRCIKFYDDDFLSNRGKKTKEFFRIYNKELKPEVEHLTIFASVRTLIKADEEMWDLLREAGVQLWVGIDHFNDNDLKYSRKGCTADEVFKVLKEANRRGITVGAFLIATTAHTSVVDFMTTMVNMQLSFLIDRENWEHLLLNTNCFVITSFGDDQHQAIQQEGLGHLITTDAVICPAEADARENKDHFICGKVYPRSFLARFLAAGLEKEAHGKKVEMTFIERLLDYQAPIERCRISIQRALAAFMERGSFLQRKSDVEQQLAMLTAFLQEDLNDDEMYEEAKRQLPVDVRIFLRTIGRASEQTTESERVYLNRQNLRKAIVMGIEDAKAALARLTSEKEAKIYTDELKEALLYYYFNNLAIYQHLHGEFSSTKGLDLNNAEGYKQFVLALKKAGILPSFALAICGCVESIIYQYTNLPEEVEKDNEDALMLKEYIRFINICAEIFDYGQERISEIEQETNRIGNFLESEAFIDNAKYLFRRCLEWRDFSALRKMMNADPEDFSRVIREIWAQDKADRKIEQQKIICDFFWQLGLNGYPEDAITMKEHYAGGKFGIPEVDYIIDGKLGTIDHIRQAWPDWCFPKGFSCIAGIGAIMVLMPGVESWSELLGLDRFAGFLRRFDSAAGNNYVSTWLLASIIAFGIALAITTGIYHLIYYFRRLNSAQAGALLHIPGVSGVYDRVIKKNTRVVDRIFQNFILERKHITFAMIGHALVNFLYDDLKELKYSFTHFRQMVKEKAVSFAKKYGFRLVKIAFIAWLIDDVIGPLAAHYFGYDDLAAIIFVGHFEFLTIPLCFAVYKGALYLSRAIFFRQLRPAEYFAFLRRVHQEIRAAGPLSFEDRCRIVLRDILNRFGPYAFVAFTHDLTREYSAEQASSIDYMGVREAAGKSLGRMLRDAGCRSDAARKALEALIKATDDPDPWVRKVAIGAIGKCGLLNLGPYCSNAYHTLAKHLYIKDEPEVIVRGAAARSLAIFCDSKEALDSLIKVVQDPGEHFWPKKYAADSIGEIISHMKCACDLANVLDVLVHFTEFRQDEYKSVDLRIAGARALGKFPVCGKPEQHETCNPARGKCFEIIIECLKKALTDPDPSVRENALWALARKYLCGHGVQGSQEFARILSELLIGDHYNLACLATEYLRYIYYILMLPLPKELKAKMKRIKESIPKKKPIVFLAIDGLYDDSVSYAFDQPDNQQIQNFVSQIKGAGHSVCYLRNFLKDRMFSKVDPDGKVAIFEDFDTASFHVVFSRLREGKIVRIPCTDFPRGRIGAERTFVHDPEGCIVFLGSSKECEILLRSVTRDDFPIVKVTPENKKQVEAYLNVSGEVVPNDGGAGVDARNPLHLMGALAGMSMMGKVHGLGNIAPPDSFNSYYLTYIFDHPIIIAAIFALLLAVRSGRSGAKKISIPRINALTLISASLVSLIIAVTCFIAINPGQHMFWAIFILVYFLLAAGKFLYAGLASFTAVNMTFHSANFKGGMTEAIIRYTKAESDPMTQLAFQNLQDFVSYRTASWLAYSVKNANNPLSLIKLLPGIHCIGDFFFGPISFSRHRLKVLRAKVNPIVYIKSDSRMTGDQLEKFIEAERRWSRMAGERRSKTMFMSEVQDMQNKILGFMIIVLVVVLAIAGWKFAAFIAGFAGGLKIASAPGAKSNPCLPAGRGQLVQTQSGNSPETEEYELNSRFDVYLKNYQLDKYAGLRGLYTPQVMRALLEDPVLQPVFLQVLPDEAVGSLEIVDAKTIDEIGGVGLLLSHSVFSVGDSEVADSLVSEPGTDIKIIIGVTDRQTDRCVQKNFPIANNRQVFFPLADGTWLGVKGSGQFSAADLPPHFYNDAVHPPQHWGLAEEKEAKLAAAGQAALEGSGARFVRLLAYRRAYKLPAGGLGDLVSTEALRNRHKEPVNPVLIFNRALTPHRLVKFRQLEWADPDLGNLRHRISQVLSRRGYLDPGKILSCAELMKMIIAQMGYSEAVKQNREYYKNTLNIQDITFAGEESDLVELVDYPEYLILLESNELVRKEYIELLLNSHLSIHGIRNKFIIVGGLIDYALDARIAKKYFPGGLRRAVIQLFSSYFGELDNRFLQLWAEDLLSEDQIHPIIGLADEVFSGRFDVINGIQLKALVSELAKAELSRRNNASNPAERPQNKGNLPVASEDNQKNMNITALEVGIFAELIKNYLPEVAQRLHRYSKALRILEEYIRLHTTGPPEEAVVACYSIRYKRVFFAPCLCSNDELDLNKLRGILPPEFSESDTAGLINLSVEHEQVHQDHPQLNEIEVFWAQLYPKVKDELPAPVAQELRVYIECAAKLFAAAWSKRDENVSRRFFTYLADEAYADLQKRMPQAAYGAREVFFTVAFSVLSQRRLMKMMLAMENKHSNPWLSAFKVILLQGELVPDIQEQLKELVESCVNTNFGDLTVLPLIIDACRSASPRLEQAIRNLFISTILNGYSVLSPEGDETIRRVTGQSMESFQPAVDFILRLIPAQGRLYPSMVDDKFDMAAWDTLRSIEGKKIILDTAAGPQEFIEALSRAMEKKSLGENYELIGSDIALFTYIVHDEAGDFKVVLDFSGECLMVKFRGALFYDDYFDKIINVEWLQAKDRLLACVPHLMDRLIESGDDRYQDNESGLTITKVSLVPPGALDYIDQGSDKRKFSVRLAEADIFDMVDYEERAVVATNFDSLAMVDSFNKEDRIDGLISLGKCLYDGGILLVGVCGNGRHNSGLGCIVYQRQYNMLVKVGRSSGVIAGHLFKESICVGEPRSIIVDNTEADISSAAFLSSRSEIVRIGEEYGNYEDYLGRIAADERLESKLKELIDKGIDIKVADIDGALAARDADTVYLSEDLFALRALGLEPAPSALIYAYLCHEEEFHSGFDQEKEAVLREIFAWESLSAVEKEQAIAWAKAYSEVQAQLGRKLVFQEFLDLADVRDVEGLAGFVAVNYIDGLLTSVNGDLSKQASPQSSVASTQQDGLPAKIDWELRKWDYQEFIKQAMQINMAVKSMLENPDEYSSDDFYHAINIRIDMLEHSNAPLSALGMKEVSALKVMAMSKDIFDIAGVLSELMEPEREWFMPYLTDQRRVALGKEVSNSSGGRLIPVWGCSTQCDHCCESTVISIMSMPWQWIEELASRGGMHVDMLMTDIIRDYYDFIYDKDGADVLLLFNLHTIVTSGFISGSVGERAFIKMAQICQDDLFVTVSMAPSVWMRSLGYDKYMEAIRNIFTISVWNVNAVLYLAAYDFRRFNDPQWLNIGNMALMIGREFRSRCQVSSRVIADEGRFRQLSHYGIGFETMSEDIVIDSFTTFVNSGMGSIYLLPDGSAASPLDTVEKVRIFERVPGLSAISNEPIACLFCKINCQGSGAGCIGRLRLFNSLGLSETGGFAQENRSEDPFESSNRGGRWLFMQPHYDLLEKRFGYFAGQALAPALFESGLVSAVVSGLGILLHWNFGLPHALAPPIVFLAVSLVWQILHFKRALNKDLFS
ncbi:MAG: HEAT repeat domain-containing protein, partial [Candidatus Omnitrophota bacterium]